MVTLKQLLLLERQFLHPHPLCLNEAWRCRFLRWKACQGLKRGLFNLCKGVWALSPIFSRDAENSKAGEKKPNITAWEEGGKKTRQRQQLAAEHWFEPRLIYMFHTETSCDFSEMRQLKERERKKAFFLWPPLTQNWGKIHPHKTMPVSALLNQQRKSVSCLCASCRLINLPLRRRESGGRLSGENDTI